MISVRRPLAAATQLAVVALVLVSCGPDAAHQSVFRPTLSWGACPADIEATFLSAHRCGVLTVLENRAEPRGRRLELLVLRVPPVGDTPPRPGIGAGLGANIGDPSELNGGNAAGATRLQRVMVGMEPRGAGVHAGKALRCPEVDILGPRAAAVRTGDPTLTASFVGAVKRCAARLRASHVDLAQYDTVNAAADYEDLRVALGVGRWAVLGTYGTESRTLLEYLRRHDAHVASAYLDSPVFPGSDDLTAGVTGTRRALHQLFAFCASRPGCAGAHPHLQQAWQRALTRLHANPLRGTGRSTSGRAVPVLVDAGKLLRFARFALGGDGPTNLTQLPDMIEAAAAGRLAPQLGTLVAEDPVFCAGYRPLCTGQNFSLGVFLTRFCREQAPYINRNALHTATDGDRVLTAVFEHSPYVAACTAWGVPAAAHPPTPVRTHVPALLITGQFDSYSDPATVQAQAQAGQLSRAWQVTVPGQTHNVLGFAECAITTRNQWTLRPTRPPATDSCATAPGPQFRR